MDDHRFDELTRAFGGARSRRQVLRFLTGGIGVTLAGSLRLESGLAAMCGKKDNPCSSEAPCCQNLACINGVCAKPPKEGGNCDSGLVKCQSDCVDATADPANCGACGVVCPGAPCRQAVCTGGVCTTAPDPAQDGAACPDGVCAGGDCVPLGCTPTKISCDPGECGVFPNGCSGTIDCGPCCDPPCASDEICGSDGNCTSPSCCSGNATCCDYTTAGICCIYPKTAMVCCDSTPGAGDGWVACCEEAGVDCPSCPGPGPLVIGGINGDLTCTSQPGDAFEGCAG